MSKYVKILLVSSVIILTACSKSPLEKLKSDRVYPDMTRAYWSNQETAHPELWKQAREYCVDNSNKPNCSSVIFNSMVDNMDTKITNDKFGQDPLTPPVFK